MNKLKKIIPNLNVLVLLALLVGLLLPLVVAPQPVSAQGWLSDYAYRQKFSLSRADGAVSNYTMVMTVNKGAGTSLNETVYLDSHAKNWTASIPNDIRFTQSDGTTLLDYGILTSNTTAAKVAVEFNSIGTTATDFYCYYGGADVADASDLSAVGSFGDDFNRANGALGGSWEVGGNTTAEVYSNEMRWNKTLQNAPPEGVFYPFTFSSNVTQLVYSKAPDLASTHLVSFLLADENPSTGSGLWGVGYKNDAGTLRFQVLKSGGWANVGTYTVGTTYVFEIKYNDSTRIATIYIDGSAVATDTAGHTADDWPGYENSIAFTSGLLANEVYSYWDGVLVRTWVSPEPTWGSWGSETGGPPSVSTSAASGLGINAATLNGAITNIGASNVTIRGFEWGTSTGTYTTGNWTEEGTFGVASFSRTVTTFTSDVVYYYRALATNADGTGYGNEQVFATLPSGGVPGWLTGYSYRQKFDLSGSSSPLTDYIMSLTVHEDTPGGGYQGFLASLPFVNVIGPFLTPPDTDHGLDAGGSVMYNPLNPNEVLLYYSPGVVGAPEGLQVATSVKGSNVWPAWVQYPYLNSLDIGRPGNCIYWQGTFYYYFCGGSAGNQGAGVYTSTDGFHFTPYDNGAAIVTATDGRGIGLPFVMVDDGIIYMYYLASGTDDVRTFMVQTSTDAIHFSNPTYVFGGGSFRGEWRSVYKIGDTYVMLYEVAPSSTVYIHMATSSTPTGVFTEYGVILTPAVDAPWSWGGVCNPQLLWNDSTNRWELYYEDLEPYVGRPIGYAMAQSSPIGSSGSTVYLNGHTLNWPNDIRFTKADGETLLEYNIDSGVGGVATAQIEFPSVPTSGTSGYIYYGKSGGAGGGTLVPSETVIFSDNFNRVNSDTVGNNWVEQGTTDGDIVSNQLQVYSTTDGVVANHVRHALTLNQDLSISWRAQGPSLISGGSGSDYGWYLNDENPTTDGSWGIQFGRTNDVGGGVYYIGISDNTTGATWPIYSTYTPDAWYTFKMQYDNSNRIVTFWVNDAIAATQDGASNAAWASYANNIVLGSSGAPSVNWLIDDIIVQGMATATPEPTWYSWYAEEEGGAPQITTDTVASPTPEGATLQGTLSSLGDYTTVYVFFQYGKTTSYELGNTIDQMKTAIGVFNQPLTGLTPGTLYYYRAGVRYGTSQYAYGGQRTFITTGGGVTPGAPTGFGASGTSTQINLNWNLGMGATQTVIWVSTDDHPTSPLTGPGVLIYTGTLTSYTHSSGLTVGVIYKYSAWSEAGGVYSALPVHAQAQLGVAPGPDELTDPSPSLEAIKIFNDFLETGDMLIVGAYRVIYDVTPSADIKEFFALQLLDGTTIKVQGVPSQWGYRPFALYQSAGNPLQWGYTYDVKIVGHDHKWTTPPEGTHPTSGGSWIRDDLTILDTWVLDTTERLEDYYGVILIDYTPSYGRSLNDQGGDIFDRAIPGLREARPHLFSSHALGWDLDDEEKEATWLESIDLATTLGEDTAAYFDQLGEFLGGIEGETAAAGLGTIAFFVIMGGLTAGPVGATGAFVVGGGLLVGIGYLVPGMLGILIIFAALGALYAFWTIVVQGV